ncbi:MAG TPA: flavodoxin [Ramlibacter sp.]|nr:flavodoxin [Ramlibacter sp.]
MSKILVVCYSYTGTCLDLARELCGQQGWQKAEIALIHPRSGTPGYWRCVLDSLLRSRPQIRYDGPPPREFEAVVLISPIWAFRLASPMRSFVARRRDHLPQVAVISVMGGAGAPNAVAEVGKLLGRESIQSAAFTMKEVEEGECRERLQSFAGELSDALASKRHPPPADLSPQTT